MKTYLDCVPCYFAQVLDACRLLGMEEPAVKVILDDVARMVPDFSLTSSPPETSRLIYALIARKSGKRDPYETLKRESNRAALAVYPHVKEKIARTGRPLRAAVEAACAGNIIDYGALRVMDLERELDAIMERLEETVADRDHGFFAFNLLTRELGNARSLLYLLDNAGEIVFDRMLLEEIKTQYPELAVTVAVRGAPIINDCLEEDAHACGLADMARIISNGADAPGTVLSLCSPGFLDVWMKSDLVISKGQGNYESLSEETKRIFFLLTVKCPVLARHIGVDVRKTVLLPSQGIH